MASAVAVIGLEKACSAIASFIYPALVGLIIAAVQDRRSQEVITTHQSHLPATSVAFRVHTFVPRYGGERSSLLSVTSSQSLDCCWCIMESCTAVHVGECPTVAGPTSKPLDARGKWLQLLDGGVIISL